MNIEHNSRKAAYREPMGAVPCGTVVILRTAIESYAIPDSVECVINDRAVRMYYVMEINNNRIYECKVEMPQTEGLVWYGFRVEASGEVAWCGNNPEFLGGKGCMYRDKPERFFQITVYDKDYKTPDWMKNAVVYQIFPDRFCRGRDTEFHGIRRNWGDEPFYRADQFGGEYTSDDFFGGNLSGIKEKLPYLKSLGITAVYLNPIFKSQSNHRYNTGDYETIDPLLGTNEEFSELAGLLRENGIRLILDGVFSHTGDDSRYFNKYGNYDSVGAYQSQDSPYYDWYSFTNWPNVYESWWGFTSLPNTNEMRESYLDYVVRNDDSIVRRWIKNGASGWRLDVADELPDEFIKEIRKSLKEADSDAVLIGEVWEDASNKVSYGRQREYFWGKSLDSVMNYVSRRAILDYLLWGDAPQFLHRLSALYENYPKEALYTCLNLISTHDVPRALTILSGAPSVDGMNREQQAAYRIPEDALELAKKRMRMAVAIQMTIPGAPCVYYGDEAGVAGYTDPFNRTCYPWGGEDTALLEFHRELIALRNKFKCLRTGDFLGVFSYEDIAIYMRSITGEKDVFGNEAENGTVLVAVNPMNNGIDAVSFSLEQYGVKSVKNALTGEIIPYNGGDLKLRVEPLGFVIVELERSDDKIVTL
ncbi:MAG: glycoside hydrolase family 13 protein [Oscillospiraceae bacterium]|nr:glycoside hydrolase family 13 protein [Oscillospiraceae bacterium]